MNIFMCSKAIFIYFCELSIYFSYFYIILFLGSEFKRIPDTCPQSLGQGPVIGLVLQPEVHSATPSMREEEITERVWDDGSGLR